MDILVRLDEKIASGEDEEFYKELKADIEELLDYIKILERVASELHKEAILG